MSTPDNQHTSECDLQIALFGPEFYTFVYRNHERRQKLESHVSLDPAERRSDDGYR